jgi:hypothetical protein
MKLSLVFKIIMLSAVMFAIGYASGEGSFISAAHAGEKPFCPWGEIKEVFGGTFCCTVNGICDQVKGTCGDSNQGEVVIKTWFREQLHPGECTGTHCSGKEYTMTLPPNTTSGTSKYVCACFVREGPPHGSMRCDWQPLCDVVYTNTIHQCVYSTPKCDENCPRSTAIHASDWTETTHTRPPDRSEPPACPLPGSNRLTATGVTAPTKAEYIKAIADAAKLASAVGEKAFVESAVNVLMVGDGDYAEIHCASTPTPTPRVTPTVPPTDTQVPTAP